MLCLALKSQVLSYSFFVTCGMRVMRDSEAGYRLLPTAFDSDQ